MFPTGQFEWFVLKTPLKFVELSGDPTTATVPANQLSLYAKDDGAGVSALFYKDDAGTVHPLQGRVGGSGSGIANQVAYWVDTTDLSAITAGTTGQLLQSTGSTLPVWTSTLTNITADSDTNTIHAVGQEIRARNDTAGTLSKGTPVYITGYNLGADRVTVDKADADASATMPAIGIVEDSIGVNANGHIIESGIVEGTGGDPLDTSAWTVGTSLYVSGTAGALTSTRPTGATQLVQRVALVLRQHATTGAIIVVGAGRANAVNNLHTHQSTGAEGGQLDHGLALTGLSDDDHSAYLLASDATSRAAFAANWTDLTDAGATTLHKHDHGGQDGLADDDHTQYALLAGRSGGQTLLGGTDSGDTLVIRGSAHANGGKVDLNVDTISTASANIAGVQITPTFTGSGTGPQGMSINPVFQPSATISSAVGLNAGVTASPSTGVDITNFTPFALSITTGSAGGTITTMYSMLLNAPSYGSTKPGTAYGLVLPNMGAAGITTAIGLYIPAQSGATNNFVFSLPADATDPTAGGGAATGRIPCLIGGALRYIPYY